MGALLFCKSFFFFSCICENYVRSLNSQTTNNMKTDTLKNREEWRALNLKIAQHQKVIKTNSAAGQKFDIDYLNWVNQLIERRDYLTTNGGF